MGAPENDLKSTDIDIEQLKQEEWEVLRQLCLYDKDQANINEVLDAILSYDQHLPRTNETRSMREEYRRTLEDKPWREL